MAVYVVKVGLSSMVSQQELMDLLRNQGAEVIQLSDGVAVKSTKNGDELKRFNAKLSMLNFELIDPSRAEDPHDLPQDLRNFVLN